MSVHTSALTTPSQAGIGTLKRTVADTIRHLGPGYSVMRLVAPSGNLQMKDQTQSAKSLISKRRVETPLYEVFVANPVGVEYTVESVTDSDTIVLTDSTGVQKRACLFNTRNGTLCRVQTAPSSDSFDIQSIGGTAFSTTAGDKLLLLPPTMEENSTDPVVRMKDPERIYNLTQINRMAVEISRSAEGNPHYGDNYFAGVKKRSVWDFMREVNNAAMTSERPSSTNQSNTDATNGNFRTTRGIINWLGEEFDAGGSMTHDRWITDMTEAFDETVGPDLDLVMICGTKIHGQMQLWVQEKLMVAQKDSMYKKFGVQAERFMTGVSSKGINVIIDPMFNVGSLQKQAVIFAPELFEYVHLRDRDFKITNNIQDNDQDGRKDGILGEWGINPIDGGVHGLHIKNWW